MDQYTFSQYCHYIRQCHLLEGSHFFHIFLTTCITCSAFVMFVYPWNPSDYCCTVAHWRNFFQPADFYEMKSYNLNTVRYSIRSRALILDCSRLISFVLSIVRSVRMSVCLYRLPVGYWYFSELSGVNVFVSAKSHMHVSVLLHTLLETHCALQPSLPLHILSQRIALQLAPTPSLR